MKKVLTLAILFLAASFFSGCSSKTDASFLGYWQGDDNLIFEVIKAGDNQYTIRNVNGDLSAHIEGGVLTGKNSIDMPFSMQVKGDSAYYQFGTIITGYKRISKEAYQEIFKTQKPAI